MNKCDQWFKLVYLLIGYCKVNIFIHNLPKLIKYDVLMLHVGQHGLCCRCNSKHYFFLCPNSQNHLVTCPQFHLPLSTMCLILGFVSPKKSYSYDDHIRQPRLWDMPEFKQMMIQCDSYSYCHQCELVKDGNQNMQNWTI